MANNPGISLFHLSDLDALNINSQQPEELEAIEDEKQRHEELKEMLQNAFDDLEDDDKQTIDSSCLTSNVLDQDLVTPLRVCCSSDDRTSYTQCPNGYIQKPNEINNNSHATPGIKSADYNTNNHLEVLYSVRLREIERLHDEINNLKKTHGDEIRSILEQFTLVESEKEKAEQAQKQTEKLLNEEKIRSSNLEKDISTLNRNLYETRNQNRDIAEKLEISSITIRDLEDRINAIGKIDKGESEKKRFDGVLNQLNVEHKQQIMNMQNQLDNISVKLVCKETEYKRLEQEFVELQKVHESILIEKSESLNRLAKQLEETQANYQNLISANCNEENFKLRIALDNLQKENEQLNTKVQSLSAECEVLRYDLHQYENLSKLSEYLTKDGISSESDTVFQIGFAKNEALRKLKDELHRAMINQKTKRNEIKELQNKLNHADGIIKKLNNEEGNYKTRIKMLEDEIKSLKDELNKIRNEARENLNRSTNKKIKESDVNKRNELEHKIISLKEDNEKLKREFSERETKFQEEKKAAIDRYNKEYMKFHEEKLSKVRQDITNEYQRKISELESRLDENAKECSEIKELYTDACIGKDKLMSSNENIKKELDEFKNINAALNDRIKCLATENERFKQLIDERKQHGDEERLKIQISQLQSELKCTEGRATILEQKIESLNEHAKRQQILNEKLQHKITFLKKELTDWKGKYEEVKNSVNSSEQNKRLLEMENQLSEYRDHCRILNEKYSRDVEMIKLSAAECITKMKVEHSEKIAHLRIEHAQNVSQFEIEHRILLEKMEKNMKNRTIQMLEEEVSRITSNCKAVLQNLIQSIEQYKNENAQLQKQQNVLSNNQLVEDNKSSAMQQKYNEVSGKYKKTIESNSKLCSELNVMQRKYENSRKAALQYKQLSEERADLLRREIEEHDNIIRNIQKQIDEAIDNKQTEVSAILANVHKQLTVSIRR